LKIEEKNMLEWLGSILDHISWFWLIVGLLVGWNLVPQPKWISNLLSWVKNKVTGG
jgi:hypothetical protein